MRLFIAIDLPDEVKEELVFVQKGIGSSDAKVSYVAKKNLHLTLKFLGEISEEKLEKLKKVLNEIKQKSFSVHLDKFGCFDSFEKPKVLWVGLKPDDELRKLANKIDSETLSFSKSDLLFKAHLTIGRVKLVKFKKDFVKKLENVKVKNIDFDVESFTLYVSRLTKQGAVYSVVERFDLGQSL